MVANFEYVIGRNDPGYGGLLLGQLRALRYLPHLFVKGSVLRDLVGRAASPQRFDPLAGLTLLALEGVCLASVAWIVRAGNRGNSELSAKAQAG